MSNKKMSKIARAWTSEDTPIKVINVICEKERPTSYQPRYFNIKDELCDFLAGVSLTHRVMFVEKSGTIFITESTNGKTNIDADLIEAFVSGLN